MTNKIQKIIDIGTTQPPETNSPIIFQITKSLHLLDKNILS